MSSSVKTLIEMKDGEKKSRKPDGRTELAATVLFEAAFTSDAEVAERYGISKRSVERYRQQLAEDPILAGAVEAKRRAFDAAWAEEMPRSMRKALRVLDKMADAISNDPQWRANPAAIEKVAGVFMTVAKVYLTNKALDARLAGRDRQDGDKTDGETGVRGADAESSAVM